MNLYTSWACPLSAHGHGSVRPIFKARRALFLSSSATPFTPLVHHPWEEGPNGVTVQNLWVDGSNASGLMVQDLWVDGSNECGLTDQMRTPSSCANIWQVVWKPLWCMTHVVLWLVFISLRLPCTSPINIRVYLSHFFIFSWNILSEHNCHPCQTAPFILLYQPSTHSLRSLDLSIINLLPPFIQKLVSVLFSTSPANTLFYFNLFS